MAGIMVEICWKYEFTMKQYIDCIILIVSLSLPPPQSIVLLHDRTGTDYLHLSITPQVTHYNTASYTLQHSKLHTTTQEVTYRDGGRNSLSSA